MAEVLSIVRTLHREIRFDSQQVGERVALRVGELAAETVGVQECLPLILRHLPEVSEGSGNQTPAVDGKSAKLLHGAPDLPTLPYGYVPHHLTALNHTPNLFRQWNQRKSVVGQAVFSKKTTAIGFLPMINIYAKYLFD